MKNGRNLTATERREIRKLVNMECANYDKHYHVCPLLGDYSCYMLTVRTTDTGLCKYFKDSLLPHHPSLQAVLLPGRTKQCKQCGREFAATGNQMYCSDNCKYQGQKAATAARVKKHRKHKA